MNVLEEMKMEEIENFIIDLADYVIEVKKMRRENEKLREYKKQQEKFIDGLVQTSWKNTVDFLKILGD